MSDENVGDSSLMDGSMFERQMSMFFEVFAGDELFGKIPEEHIDLIVGLMTFSAFQVSLAARAHAMTLLKDAPRTPAIAAFEYDTRQMFEYMGSDLDRVMRIAQQMHPEAEKARQHYM